MGVAAEDLAAAAPQLGVVGEVEDVLGKEGGKGLPGVGLGGQGAKPLGESPASFGVGAGYGGVLRREVVKERAGGDAGGVGGFVGADVLESALGDVGDMSDVSTSSYTLSPTNRRVFIGLLLGMLVSSISQTIVGPAMPRIVTSVVGPIAGGAITDHIGWRWLFYITLPLGIIALIVLIATALIANNPLRDAHEN